jgi:hypothetical protein
MLDDDVVDHVPANIRESKVTAAVAVCQTCMVEPEQMKQRCIDIVRVNGFVGRAVSEVVGSSVNHAALDPTPCQGDAVAVGIVVTAEMHFGG